MSKGHPPRVVYHQGHAASEWEARLYHDEVTLKEQKRARDISEASNVSAYQVAALDAEQGEGGKKRWETELRQFLDERALILSLYKQGLALDLDKKFLDERALIVSLYKQGLALDLDKKVDTSDIKHDKKSVWEILLLSLIDHLDASIHKVQGSMSEWDTRLTDETADAHRKSQRLANVTASLADISAEISRLRGAVASGHVAHTLAASLDGERSAAALQKSLLSQEMDAEIDAVRRLLASTELAAPADCVRPADKVGVASANGTWAEFGVPALLKGSKEGEAAWGRVVAAFGTRRGASASDLGRGLNASTHAWGLGWGAGGADLEQAHP
ncbi:hypothetical protein T484DRAFT_1760574, partial [Baffinella frigidus]